MISIIKAQFAKDLRNPLLILLLIAGSILAILLFTDGVNQPTTVAIFSEEENASQIEKKWHKLLNTDDSFDFVIVDPVKARNDIREGKMDVAVKLMEMDYRLVITNELPKVFFVQQHVDKIFQREAQITALTKGNQQVQNEVESVLDRAPFQIQQQGVDQSDVPNHNMRIQLMFAFTFLVSMFLIGFRVNNITHDRAAGVWHRMILSPMRKTSMYCGYLIYSFLITLFQILTVLFIFKYVMNYELGENFWLILLIAAIFTFSMISIAMLITGFVRTPEMFYVIYSTFIPMIPLISGAYMMPGTITQPIILFIADLFPLAHAMEAIMSVIFYQAGLQDIMIQLLIMILISVIAMGIGINLIERRSD